MASVLSFFSACGNSQGTADESTAILISKKWTRSLADGITETLTFSEGGTGVSATKYPDTHGTVIKKSFSWQNKDGFISVAIQNGDTYKLSLDKYGVGLSNGSVTFFSH